MPTDCKSPNCHEAIKTCLAKKVSHKALLYVCLCVGVPLFAVGAGVWSETKNMKEKFVSVREMEPHVKNIEANKSAVQRIPEDIKTIQRLQEKNAEGINDILQILVRMDKKR